MWPSCQPFQTAWSRGSRCWSGIRTRNTDLFFFFSSRRRHTRYWRDWSSDVCSSDLATFELGVRYVLEGSVRKAGNRIRVTAQLIEAGTSNHVWAERYDRDLADIFAMQDELTQALTTALAPAIADAELRRAMRKPPESLDAWAAYQRGLWHLSKATPDDDATAERFFKHAIDLDPTFAGGYSALALYQLQAAAIYQKLDLPSAQRSAEALARRAVALDGADPESRSCLGWALQARGDAVGALAEIQRPLSMGPNHAIAHGHRGATLIFAGL